MDYIEILKSVFIDEDRYMYMLRGLGFSLSITLLSVIIGIIFGILIALMRLSRFYPLKHSKKFKNFNPLSCIALIYVDIVRGTPVVVQLMIFANLIFVGKLRNTPILIVASLAFGLNSAAYVAEIIRAGIEGLDKGQTEAARALGLNYFYTMKEVIIPQSIRNILPALVSEFITLLKETSIVGFIGGIDLLRSANIITSQTYRGVEPLIAVGLIYLIMTSLFTLFMRRVERGLKISD